VLRLTRFSPITPSMDSASLALTQWIRAAAQRNIDALVKVGDYYYHGLGIPDELEQTRLEKAAKYYQAASDTQMSALAMWNLGWMYENGIGVPQVRFTISLDFLRELIIYSAIRISISPNDTMIWHWRPIQRLICRWFCPWLNCMHAVSGTR